MAEDNQVSGKKLEECEKENKALKSRNNLLEMLQQGVDRMNIPVHIIDKDYKILFINQACLDLLGMSRDQAMGRYCHDLYKTKNCRSDQCPCRMAMEKDSPAECENLTGSGQIIQCFGAPLKDENGRLIGAVEYFPDVTAQKQAVADILRVADEAKKGNLTARTDRSLHTGDYQKMSDGINSILDIIVDKNAWYESILDAIKAPITVTDMDSRWTFVNKAVEDMLKVNRREILGRNCSSWGANICNTQNCGITRLKNGFNTTKFEQNGGYYNVDCSYVKNIRGENIGHVEVITDVTSLTKVMNYAGQEIEHMAKVYAIMASGDLTQRYELTPPDEYTKSTHDQIVVLRDAVRGIITNLKQNIADVNKRMEDLTATAEAATRSVEDGSKGVQQIAQNAGKVSQNAESVSLNIEQVSKAMQDMSAAIEEITSSMESVSTLSKETNDISQKGAKLASDAEKSMNEISTHSVQVYEIVSDVDKQMGEISKIVVLIRELASQTNLLALNAAIEAARAGDAGRGFAVVATEVKSLAQESRSSAERIEEMIGNLQKSTQHASAAMGDARDLVENGSKMVTETVSAFNNIASAIDKVAKSATEVAAATEEQAATTEEITASINEVSRVIEQTAKEAGDAAAATEESAAALDEITRMVKNVSTVAEGALEANRKFRVK